MSVLFIQYPRCSTCVKAKKFLEANGVEFNDRHIIENNPTKTELKEWIQRSGLEYKKFFNTSGKLYKEMNLKDRLKEMSEDEAVELLGTNGMLVKRPLIVSDDRIILGFKEEEYLKLK